MFELVREMIKQNRLLKVLLAGPIRLRRVQTRMQQRSANQVLANLEKYVREDILIHIPEFDSAYWISPRSDLFKRLAYRAEYEPKLVKLFLDHISPDADVVDIGANIGFYTVAAAKRMTTRRVLAIEPTMGAFKRLQRNIETNAVSSRVILEKVILSDVAGEQIQINVIPGREEYSTIGDVVHPAVLSEEHTVETVMSTTLDTLVEKHGLRPGVLKIDVEGAEYRALLGARRTLEKHRPFVIAECVDMLLRKQGSSSAAVISLFTDLGYRVIDPMYPNVPLGRREHGDIFCIPNP